MSLLLPNQLSVWLHPQQVAVVELDGFKKRALNKQFANVAQTNEVAWEGSVATLKHMLTAKKFDSKRLQVTLASDFVRYLVLPPHMSVNNVNEKTAFARAAFQENYGAVVSDWAVTVDDARPDLNAVAVAVDQALLDALTHITQDKPFSLASVQPFLMGAYNQMRTKNAQQASYLAIVEKSRILFSGVSEQGWVFIRNLPLAENWPQQLQHLLEREALSATHAIPKQVKLYTPHQQHATLPSVSGWTISRIAMPNTKETDNRVYAMLEAA